MVPLEAQVEPGQRDGHGQDHEHQIAAGCPLGDGRQFDSDLLRVFARQTDSPAGETAARFLSQHEGELVTRVAYWTGEAAPLVRALVRVLRDRAATLALRVSGLEAATLIELTAFGTAVMMHWRYTRGVRAPGREGAR